VARQNQLPRAPGGLFLAPRVDSHFGGASAGIRKNLLSVPRLNRFTPIYVGGAIVPAGYAGNKPEVALWEMVLRSVRHDGIKRVMEKETRDRYLIETKLNRPLKLLDLRRPAIANLAAPGKRAPELINAWPSAYDVTRAWVQELYTRLPGIDGFIYESHDSRGVHCPFPAG
jgi:hypothetical protein